MLRQQPVDLGNPHTLRRIALQPLEAALAPQLATFGFEVFAVKISHGPLWALLAALASATLRDAVKEEALSRIGMGYHEIVAGHTTPSELRALVEKLVPGGGD